MGRYLDPRNDFIFKRIFGQNPHLLRSFLNALLPLAEDRTIISLEYLQPENVPDNPMHKYSIVDVKCTDNYKRKFIVEMQMQRTDFFCKRMLHYVTYTYSRQANRGTSYNVPTVYGLGILNHEYDNKTSEYYHHYQIANCKNIEEKIEGIEIVMVELPKFKPETMTEKRMAALWLRFLNEVREMYDKVSPDLLENEEIAEAIQICQESAYTEAEMETYLSYQKLILSQNTYEEMLQQQFDDCTAKGMEEAAHKIAANMIAEGFATDIVARLSGLTADAVEAMRKV